MPPDAVMDLGDCATLQKTLRNTTPVIRPSHFGEVVHMDIVFGPDISIGNIHYGLIFTDRYSRMTYTSTLSRTSLLTSRSNLRPSLPILVLVPEG